MQNFKTSIDVKGLDPYRRIPKCYLFEDAGSLAAVSAFSSFLCKERLLLALLVYWFVYRKCCHVASDSQ